MTVKICFDLLKPVMQCILLCNVCEKYHIGILEMLRDKISPRSHMLILFFSKMWNYFLKGHRMGVFTPISSYILCELNRSKYSKFWNRKKIKQDTSDFSMVTNKKSLMSNILSFFTNISKTVPKQIS